MNLRKLYKGSMLHKAYVRAERSYYIGWLLSVCAVAGAIGGTVWGINGYLLGWISLVAAVGVAVMLTWTAYLSAPTHR